MSQGVQLLSKAVDVYQKEGIGEVADRAWRKTYQTLGTKVNYGLMPFDREWDVLIILDACRYDLFEEFAPKHEVYDRFESVEPVYSCASSSKEWLEKSFVESSTKEVEKTYYITANGFTSEVETSKLYGLEEVWRYGIDPEYSIVPPEPVTNAAIDCYRSSDADRYIIHYTPPHAPFLHCAGKYNSAGGGVGGTQVVWEGLKAGEFELAEVWQDYGQNLLTVLDHVEILLENMSGNIVVSADHGNAVGEFGVYGHPIYCPVPAVKRVPWATATGDDLETYDVHPTPDRHDEKTSDEDVKEHLKDLGYVV